MKELTNKNIEEIIKEILKEKKSNFKYSYKSTYEEDTLNLGYIFGKYLKKDSVISLNGELGSGKTVFTKGIGKYFNIQDDISSPTFTIVNEYITDNFPIYHFDIYRLNDIYNFLDTIGDEYFCKGACILEWGNFLNEILPRQTIHIDFKKLDDNSRNITIWR